MDDHDKETLTGAGIGALVGGVLGGPVGATVGGALGGAFGSHEEKHQAVLRETHSTLLEQTSHSAKLYIDHINPDGAEPGNTQNVLEGVDGKPDLIVTDPHTKNLIVEVETWEGIQDDPEHALNQLEDFRKQGYKRLLVVPEDEIESVYGWVDDHEQRGNIEGPELTIASPNRLEEL